MFTLHKTRMNLSTRDPNHQIDGFWVPNTLFLKKGDWPKFGSLDQTSVNNHFFILKNRKSVKSTELWSLLGFKKKNLKIKVCFTFFKVVFGLFGFLGFWATFFRSQI